MFGHAIASLIDVAIHTLPLYVTLGVATVVLTCYGFYIDSAWLSVTLWSLSVPSGWLTYLCYRFRDVN